MIYPWQTQLWDGLQRRLASLPHALLIHGPQGVGKLALAEHLAQSLLCESEDRRKAPCGACDGCRWFLAGSHPDFRRVEPEALARRPAAGEDEEAPAGGPASTRKPSNEIRIEQIRGLDGFLNHQSHRGGRRIALVHPAEAMNVNAANALLKSLEEPPGSAAFILVSHRAARLPATIRSRCVTASVGIPPLDSARAWLAGENLCEQKSRQVYDVCEGFFCPSLGTAADYRNWMLEAGLEVRRADDWTTKVAQTWEICRRRVARSQLHRLARWIDRDTSVFLHRFETILAAYRSGAMQYGCFIASKPNDR